MVMAAAAVGALAFTFTDSFWFNAVEGEVYAMSSLLTAITFWAILKWERAADEPNHYRWLILIAYIIGLSIGVHLLNLLTIPALTYIVYFKKYKFSVGGFLLAGVIAVAVTGFIQVILIPAVVSLAGFFELHFVNDLGLPFNSGTIIYFVILIAAIVFGLIYTAKTHKTVLNTIILSFMFILIGYSSFFMLVIRANANTPINENEPKDAISMLSYLKREQYGSWPLLYGPYYTASPIESKQKPDAGTPIYYKNTTTNKYDVVARMQPDQEYDDAVQTIFPRMWNGTKKTYRQIYENYIDQKQRVVQKDGREVLIPTFGQNLAYFVDYQCGWMYWRYFLWNFVGRQNDNESQGEVENGNWVSGIGFIDNARLGDQSNLPRTMQSSSNTNFYFLPLILGLVGLFYQLKKDMRNCWVVFLLFFMTGIAIVIYLNQTPYQPRERDYSYAGSFYAFAIWIGFGVLAAIDGLMKLVKNPKIAIPMATAVCMFVPVLMAAEGWEGHDRSGKTSARDWGKNYLTELPKNSVIFTRGDNDTFPLWYVQEVENYRTDVRVCNYMLSSGYWYVHQMGRKIYESERMPLSLTPAQYDNGINDVVFVVDRYEGPMELKDAIAFVKSDNPNTKITYNGKKYSYLPTRYLKLTVDAEKVRANGIIPTSMLDREVPKEIVWMIEEGTQVLYKNELMLLDFMASNDWERPVYFTSFSDMYTILGIDDYLYQEGMSQRFIPVVPEDNIFGNVPNVYEEGSFDLLVNKSKWGNLNRPDVTVDRESMRELTGVKIAYICLAQSLVTSGKYSQAEEVMDRYQQFFPDEKLPYGKWENYFVDLYYAIGRKDKADALSNKIKKNAKEELNYYNKLKPKFKIYYTDAIKSAQKLAQ